MKTRIAVIEDNAESMQLIVYLLNHSGYETVTAINGLAGLNLIKREIPDLIICDIQLPGLTGIEIAEDLKSQDSFKQIPLIAVTADSMVGDKERIMTAGFDGYIPKPIDAEIFVSQIANYLDEHKRIEERETAEVSKPSVTE